MNASLIDWNEGMVYRSYKTQSVRSQMIITLTEMTRILQQRETCTFLEKGRFIGNVKQNSFNS